MHDLHFPFAHGGPLAKAAFRSQLDDFIVDERLGFLPDGEGEHQYLQITKRGINTEWLARQLAEFAGVKPRDLGFCGLKDRHAVATQWFSVCLPKQPLLNWSAWAAQAGLDIEILQAGLGKRKLRRGQHQHNSFQIRLRNLQVSAPQLEHLLVRIAATGVPNYFGEQRFGREGRNLAAAQRWLEQGVPLARLGDKAMIMSAARSYIFNLVLAARVRDGSWCQILPGDPGEAPTGPLWGRGRPQASDATQELERATLTPWAKWLDGLEHCGLQQERRALVLQPKNLWWHFAEGTLTLKFDLAPGQYATALLREVAELDNLSAA